MLMELEPRPAGTCPSCGHQRWRQFLVGRPGPGEGPAPEPVPLDYHCEAGCTLGEIIAAGGTEA